MRLILCVCWVFCGVCISVAMGSYSCWFICGRDGVKTSPDCREVGEDPCAGTCTRYLFDDPVTCYYCDTTSWPCPTCQVTRPRTISAEKYIGACGQNPYLLTCICQDNWILQDPDSSFLCPIAVISGLECPYPNPGGSSGDDTGN
jgi:hypothetical protein